MKQFVLLVALALVAGAQISLAQTYTYSMEYQISLDRSLFDSGRGPAIDTYVSSWSSVTGVDTSSFQVTETVRTDALTRISECGSDAAVRLREYIDGDLDGLVTVDIKAVKDGLSREDAEEEPFAPSAQYEDVSDWQIERDIHPCQADYSSNTRVFLSFVPALATCADVAAFYPDAVTASDTLIGLDEPTGVTYLYILNGTYDGFPVSLTTELNYSSLEDALSDTSRGGGEFSYTVLGADGGHTSFSDATIDVMDEDYFAILALVDADALVCEDDEEVSSEESTDSSEESTASSANSPRSSTSRSSRQSSDSSFSDSENAASAHHSAAVVLFAALVVLL